jgi:hypothetical protein
MEHHIAARRREVGSGRAGRAEDDLVVDQGVGDGLGESLRKRCANVQVLARFSRFSRFRYSTEPGFERGASGSLPAVSLAL